MNKVPKLRFKEFSGEWEEKKLGDINDVRDGTHNSPKYLTTGYPLVTSKNVQNGKIDLENVNYISLEDFNAINKRSKVSKGDILMGMIGTIGNLAIVDREDFAIKNVALIKEKDKLLNNFLYQILQSKIFYKKLSLLNEGGTQKFISLNNIRNLCFNLPNLKEQEKIGNFLSSVDKKISIAEEKLNLFNQYKKGIMQKIFSQELRFKDENGNNYPEWEEKTLNSIFERITEKNKENNDNVLTISAQYGLISQTDFFNKSVAGKDLTKYYLIHRNDFAYNKSYSTGYPMGAIKRLTKYDKGIVSTLYICFRVKNNDNVSFLEQFFESKKIEKSIQDIAQEGARNHGLLNISVGDFFDITINVPCLEEQQKIADFLSAIDNKIENISDNLENLKLFKKSMLQKMFV